MILTLPISLIDNPVSQSRSILFSPKTVMTPQMTIIVLIGAAIPAWYFYQVATRKKERIRFKLRRMIIYVIVYLPVAGLLNSQGLPPLESGLIAILAGFGAAWVLVKAPSESRRMPMAIRREVIARDLTSKELEWDSTKHHLDHIVPLSRGGDHSVRNLRVVTREANLRKGKKMPGFRDFK